MYSSVALNVPRQFSLAYLLGEIALIGIALAAMRLALLLGVGWTEVKAVLFCVAFTAGCGAAGGMCFRMALGLVGGGIFSVSSIPLLCIALGAASH
jgi:hypothetical protein